MIIKTYTCPCGETYVKSPKHRKKPTQNSSQWTIDFNHEMACFDYGFSQNWIDNGFVFSILVGDKDELYVVGINHFNQSLRIAKYRQDYGSWHGYPADNNNKPNDRLTPLILDAWMNNKLISKSMRSKIQGGRL
jgi:hypothetical protein